MLVTSENYFSNEMQQKYFSVSQYKSMIDCPSRTIAEINGDYERAVTTSLLIGSYVDAHFEGTLNDFEMRNPGIFKKDGTLKKDYIHANYIIERIEDDNKMLQYLGGEKQVIKTGDIEGVPFKIKMDAYHPGKAIVDLKIMKDFKPQWKNKVLYNFVEFWGYDLQAAIYQYIEGNRLPFYIVAATKEKEPDKVIIKMDQNRLDGLIDMVKDNINHYN